HLADAVCYERQVPVVVEQPGFGPRDVRGEPSAMGEGNELVLPAVQEQHGNGDMGQLEPPGADGAQASSHHPWLPGSRPRSGVNERTGVGSLQDRQVFEGKDPRPCLSEYRPPTVSATTLMSCSLTAVRCRRSWRRWPGLAPSC